MANGDRGVLCCRDSFRCRRTALRCEAAWLDRPDGEVRWNDGRPKKDDDATQNLRPEDKTQRARKGTKIGLLPKDEVMAVFRKIAKPR